MPDNDNEIAQYGYPARFAAGRRGHTRVRWFVPLVALASASSLALAADITKEPRRSISELAPIAKIHVGRTADWVAISDDAVWVGTTGPNGVVEIDPRTNTLTASIPLPGNPCAGLAVGFGGLWVPLCAKPNALARIDLRTRAVTLIPKIGPADREGGIASGGDSIWLVIDGRATLARIDPETLRIRQRIRVPPGSLNPLYSDGLVWITRSTGAEVTVVNADSGAVIGKVPSGPKPRFLASGAGSVWTLNQGDGTLTRIEVRSRTTVGTTSLWTPGHGGDVAFGRGVIWTTMAKVPLSATDAKTGKVLCQWTGPGGDSLGVSPDTIWLTDYDAGDLYRFDLDDALHHCIGPPPPASVPPSAR
jgi:virginiamycin B lyase